MRIRQVCVCVHACVCVCVCVTLCVCERERGIASAYVPSGGLQMCLRTREGAPGERRQKNGVS